LKNEEWRDRRIDIKERDRQGGGKKREERS
jgi:hypothetical protein